MVVLPAPLEPIRDTIFPLSTENETPQTTHRCPNCTVIFSICRRGAVVRLSKVHIYNFTVIQNGVRRSLCDDFPMMHYNDSRGGKAYRFHHMFHDQY